MRRSVFLFLLLLLCQPVFTHAKNKRNRSTSTQQSGARGRVATPQQKARAPKESPVIDAATINDVNLKEAVAPKSEGAAVVRASILLDRANFSVGEIDGVYGPNFERAIAGFQESRGVPPGGVIDEATWAALNADAAPAVVPYRLRSEDVEGHFVKVPEDMMEKATLESLGYENALEGLGEKFHCSPSLLKKLNPGKTFSVDEEIMAPGVETLIPVKVGSIEVSKSKGTVRAFDPEGKLIGQYPATMGSEHDPLPIGQWKIEGVAKNPPFHYNPALFWDADSKHSKAKVPPGPNNPVGVVWIDLSKDHYGIHGAPEPSKVGHTQSHGCIRLTNWDAMELANLVSPGVPANLVE